MSMAMAPAGPRPTGGARPRAGVVLSIRPVHVPARLSKPEVRPLNSHAVAVLWTPPADLAAALGEAHRRGGSAPLVGGFRLRYRSAGPDGAPPTGPDVLPDAWPADAQQATLKWLKSNHTYIFDIAAFNEAGQGPWSDESEPFQMPSAKFFGDGGQGRMQASLAEHAHIRPEGFSSSVDSIEISWRKPCDRGAAITNFDVKYSQDPDFGPNHTQTLQVDGSVTTLVVRDLEPNTTYYFLHRAVNEVGASDWSSLSAGISTTAKPPEAPCPPLRIGDEDSSPPFELSLKWEAPESYSIPIQHFSVRTSMDPSMSDAIEIALGDRLTGINDSSTTRRIVGEAEGELSGNVARPSSALVGRDAPTSPAGRRPGCTRGAYALTQMKVKGLRPLTNYYFQVKAINQIGESSWSKPSGPMKTKAAAPGACSRPVFASGTSSDGIHLFWTPPEFDGLPITRFDLRVSRAVMMNDSVQMMPDIITRPAHYGDDYSPEAAEGDMATVARSCWPPGIEHFYQVRAWNMAGNGEWSAVSSMMQVAPESPTTPNAPNRFDSLPRAIVVHWDEPDCRGSPLEGHRLRYAKSRDMREPVEVAGVRGLSTSFGVTGLVPHVTYHFQVCSFNAVGCSEWSPASRPIQVRHLPPGKMGACTLVKNNASSIVVGFQAPIDCGTEDGRLIQSYVVRYADSAEELFDGGGAVRTIRHAKASGAAAINLKPGRPQVFHVFAVNEFGEGDPSDQVIFHTDPAPPEAPAPPRMVEFTAWSIVITFGPGEDNGIPVTHYGLHVEDIDGDMSWEIAAFEAMYVPGDSSHHYNVTGLKPGIHYRFRVFAQNAMGRSGWSKPSEDLHTDSTEPDKVLALRISEETSTTFKVSWEEPLNNGGAITQYYVQWNKENAWEKGYKEAVTPGSLHEFVCTNCLPGCFGYARVAAMNSLGRANFSDSAEATMLADAPHAPIKPEIGALTHTTGRFFWGMPYDCGDPVLRYKLFFTQTAVDGHSESERDSGEVVIEGQKRYCDIFGLKSEAEYHFKVCAENSYGAGPWSELSDPKRTKGPEVPGPPGAPAFKSVEVTSLTATWVKGEDNGAPITEQVIRFSRDPTFPPGKSVEFKVVAKGKPLEPKAPPPGTPRPASKTALEMDLGTERKSPVLGKASSEKYTMGAGSEYRRHVTNQNDYANGKFLTGMGARRKRTVMAGEEYCIENLEAGTKYYAMVACRNKTGLGPFGPVSEPIETECAAPLAIAELGFLAWDHESVTVTWDIPDAQGTPILSYTVRCARSEPELHDSSCPEHSVKAGPEHERPRFRVPGLLPGTHYFAMVKAENIVGSSPWTRSTPASLRTRATFPARMPQVHALVSKRTKDSVTFTWSLPDEMGSPITMVEFKHDHREMEEGPICLEQMMEKTTTKHSIDPHTGRIVNEQKCGPFAPGVLVTAIARAFNEIGPGDWCMLESGPAADFANVTLPMEPSVPECVEILKSGLTPFECGFKFKLGKMNGSLFERFTVRFFSGVANMDVHDVPGLGPGLTVPLGEGRMEDQLLWEWTEELSPEDGERIKNRDPWIMREVDGLTPGTVYAFQVRAENGVGPSPWSSVSAVVRTKPDRPFQNCSVLSEYTAPSFVQMKWRDPPHNGAPILAYDFRWTAVGENLPLEQWNAIPEDVFARDKKKHNYQHDAQTFEVGGLASALPHWFIFRVRNSVGYSDWSDTSRFVTKPTRPANIVTLSFNDVRPYSMQLQWNVPRDHGCPINRYDVVASPSLNLMRWARMTGEMMFHTNDLDRLFGLDKVKKVPPGAVKGMEQLAFLDADEAVYAPLEGQGPPEYNLRTLVPGREYHFMVRAVSDAGKSNWSVIKSAMRTKATIPRQAPPILVETLDSGSCVVSVKLPYDNGEPISAARLTLRRLRGPVSEEEVHAETGGVHGQHTGREVKFDPRWDQAGAGSETRSRVVLDGLLAGTDYDVVWSCSNRLGEGPLSELMHFKTKPGLPDLPERILHPGGD